VVVDLALSGELADKSRQALTRLPEQLVAVGGDALAYVCALSDFAAATAQRHADWLADRLRDDAFSQPPARGDLAAVAASALDSVSDMDSLQRALRQLRNRQQLWIVWRHLVARAPLEETTASLSDLADELIGRTLDMVHGWVGERDGEPRDDAGNPQRLVVLALGKLGARELNLSSDVDLIFTYPHAGETDRGKTHQQFFVRVGQQLIQALDTITADGFAFRVDMRLRPFGKSGPLAMHFAALEDYYVAHGRDWERYALIKARACAGDMTAGAELLDSLRPFVYRRYLDFGALDALRDMKARLYAERHDPDDLKLGPGGIRDVELTAQVQQLIWGGRQPALQDSRLLRVLPAMAELGHLEVEVAERLAAGYRFLRDAEHSLQAEQDQQTQSLPAQALSRLRLARSLGFVDHAAFTEQLDRHRALIGEIFAAVVGEVAQADSDGLRLWLNPDDLDRLAAFGFADPGAAAQQLAMLVAARDRSSVGSIGRERLDRLMPVLLDRVRLLDDPGLALARVVPVLKAVMRRSAYLALLHENPDTLPHFLDLAVHSRWLAEQLTQHPAFFDALLDQRHMGALPDRATLAADLHEQIRQAEPAGQERVLDVLREFKEHHVFNVALAEVRGTLPLMNASDYLTFLAEAVLDQALDLAWRENAERFPAFAEPPARPRPFIIVGYGKLGGIELGPGSDLDLVFIHDLPDDAGQFLHRLVRRLLHIITVPTYMGSLYEVDMRLRPSGKSGTMVSSLDAFRDYQQHEAWVWEHQALVRARGVAGDRGLLERFEAVRRDVLCRPRDPDELCREVLAMRQRMAEHLGSADDLKQGSGGIVDIEFMVQYLVLAHAHQHPDLAVFTDNVRILETADRLGLLPADAAGDLRQAYLALRTEWHRSVLDLPDTERAAEVLARHRDRVRGVWQDLFGVAASSAGRQAGRHADGS
jgi:[glutamine synthetase] adenylyltransferase / [glutamine synthetase]-adenylyl-L-tyrosine phosphorylase